LPITLNKLLDNIVEEKIHKIKQKQIINVSDKFNLLLSRRKPETKSVYVSEINKFLNFTKKQGIDIDSWAVRKFFDHLENNEYSRSYQRNAWFALKKYFKALGIPWELDTNEYPQLDKSRVAKVTLSREQVIRMIKIIQSYGSDKEKVLLCLCSVYALRRSEVCGIKEKDINREQNILYIRTKKNGEPRYHLIPEEIRSYIYPWDFDTRISISGASVIFNNILKKAKIKKLPRMGIHSLRRSVITELNSSGIAPMRVYNFARWKRGQFGMLSEYDNPDFREVDKQIFKKHPFLRIWR